MTPKSNTSDVEVADIFKQYGEEFISGHRLTKRQHDVIHCIMNCRTATYGYHIDGCGHCGHIEKQFNSCRNRHCPKCQGISRQKWVTARLNDLLCVPYYHVVFTLPHFLNELISYNKKLIYELLMDKSSETLMAFGRDPKWLGGEIGFYGVLHTWGQTLWPHVHVHFIVAGGALADTGQWIAPNFGDKFLFPVHALSKVFRGKFIQGLKKAFYNNELAIAPNLLPSVGSASQFECWIDTLAARNWVVYCKPPFDDASQVVNYIGRYTHSVAISNRRIVSAENGKVRFLYKDYKRSRTKWYQTTLDAREFIRRFIWHVLPKGFHKIRHYGFLANGRCKQMVEYIRAVIDSAADLIYKSFDYLTPCPKCAKGRMMPLAVINRVGIVVYAKLLAQKPAAAFDTS